MTPADFLRAIWPQQGIHCLAVLTGEGKIRQYFSESPAALVDRIPDFEGAGHTVFHACASFATKKSRRADNAAFVRSLWMDIDVDAANSEKYATQADAANALALFIRASGLPLPWVVDSGGGVHCYWVFNEDVEAKRAVVAARLLKRLAQHHGFRIDPSRTADMASVLRPAGTLNLKYNPPRRVDVKYAAAPLEFADVFAAIEKAARVLPDLGVQKSRKNKESANAEFGVTADFAPADSALVAKGCAQIGKMRATLGDVSEPLWYASLGVILYCVDGKKIAHEWSVGHANYSHAETEVKLAQLSHFGPTTCAKVGESNPATCAACPYRGKITSPIQLGVQLVELPPLQAASNVVERGDSDSDEDEEGLVLETPRGFVRSEQGVWFVPSEGENKPVHPYDIYVEDIAFDESARHEVCIIKHFLPHEGWKTFAFRSALVVSEKDFEMAMRDSHVKPANSTLLRIYVLQSMTQLQKVRKIRKLYASMGWKEDMSFFVLGEKAYYPNGRVELVGLSPTIRATAEGIHTKGSLESWAEATTILGNPGMEGHALIFAAGAGAPLLKFTGFEGAVF